MPRNGAMVLTDLEDPKLRLLCEKCGLRRQYGVQELLNKVGNAMLPGLIAELARRNGCARVPARVISDQCGFRIRAAEDSVWIASAPS